MKISAQEPGMVLSAITHVAVIVWGLVSLSSPKPFDELAEAVPVDVISESQFREMTKGDLKEKQVRPETPLRVDRVAKVEEQKERGQEKKDVPAPPPPPLRPAVKEAPEDIDDADKPETAKAVVVPPPPKVARIEPPKPEPVKPPPARPEPAKVASTPAKPEPEEDEDKEAEIIKQRALKQKQLEQQKAEEARKLDEKKKAEAKRQAELEAAEARKEAEEKARADAARAEAQRKAAEAKKAEDEQRRAEAARKLAEDNKRAQEAARKAAEAKKAEEARKAAEKAESDKLQAAIRNRLLSSREAPSSSGSTGQQVTRTASAGAPTATGQKLSPSDREQLMGLIKEQMERCWSITGTSNPSVKPLVRLQLTQTGAILTQPALANSSGDPAFNAIAESGMRAIRQCAPYRIPAKFADKYDDWKTITVKLDPTDLL